MSERQRSLAEVDQRLNDLQSAPSVKVSTIKASLDTVTEATVEDLQSVGATPLLLNSRSVSSSVGEPQIVGDFVRRMENGDYVSGISDSSCEPVAQKILGVEDSKNLESPIRQALKQPRSTELHKLQKDVPEEVVQMAACGSTAAPTSTPGASASMLSRMVSMPTRSESIPRAPVRPLVMSGSANGGSFRGPLRHTFVNQPAVAVPSTSPWRHSSQHLANGSSDSLSRGVSPSPATPRGSSMPADARRIFAAQAVASPQPSVSSPRSSAGMPVPGSMTPLTPRLPLQAARTISGYPSASSGALGGQSMHSLEGTGTPRPRSVSAGQVTVPSSVSQAGGTLSARSVSTIPLTQYGSRFSAVAAASSTGPMSVVRASSRGATPQTLSVNGCRFVPVASPLSACEVPRGRETSLNPGSHRATSASTSITRGGSPTPGSIKATHSSPAVVRQSSAVRPLSSLNATTRQVSTSSNWPGSSSPAPGSFEACVGSSGHVEETPAVNTRALSPPHVAAVAAAAAAAVKSSTLRHNHGGHLPGNSTPQPQPSRYAYVHSNPRRDCQPQAHRDARRRGRM